MNSIRHRQHDRNGSLRWTPTSTVLGEKFEEVIQCLRASRESERTKCYYLSLRYFLKNKFNLTQSKNPFKKLQI